MLIQVVYTILFVGALFGALMVVLSRHAVYSALSLIATMTAIAGLFVMMNAQLAGALQVIVYAGAIMVLFLFVIMLLNVGKAGVPVPRTRVVRVLGTIGALAFAVQVVAMVAALRLAPRDYSLAEAPGITMGEVARLLLTDYVYAFIMTSVLLLVAVVGAIVLARRHLIQGTRMEPGQFDGAGR